MYPHLETTTHSEKRETPLSIPEGSANFTPPSHLFYPYFQKHHAQKKISCEHILCVSCCLFIIYFFLFMGVLLDTS